MKVKKKKREKSNLIQFEIQWSFFQFDFLQLFTKFCWLQIDKRSD